MSKIYKNHVAEVALDFGVIGDQYVDVFYDWICENPSSDPMQPPEKEGPVIKDVMLFVDGQEVSIFHWLSPRRIDDLADLIRERW